MKAANSPQRRHPASLLTKDYYQVAFQFGDVALSLLDPDLTILDVNEQQCRLLGRTRNECLGIKFGDLLSPAMSDRILQLRQALRQSNPIKLEAKIVIEDGVEIAVSISARQFDTAKGKRILASLRPLSERTRSGQPVEGHTKADEELRVERAEREQTEITFRESQRQLASIIGSAMDAIVTVDSDQRVILFNAAAEKMFGCPADVAIGQSLDHFIPERFRASHPNHIHTFGETNTTSRSMGSQMAISGLRAGGEEFPIEASISQAVVGGRKLFTVIIRDITIRRLTENELKRQARLLDLSHEAIFMWDLYGGIRYWNHGAEELYGWKKDEALGCVGHSLLKTVYPIPYKRIVEALLGEGQWAGELIHRTRDGRQIVVESRHLLVREVDDELYVLETNRDVTERKRAEGLLRNQAALLDQATDAILVRDLEDRILFWSKGAEQIYGWSAEEAIGKNMQDLHYRETNQDFYAAKQVLLERGKWLGETHHVTKDGKKLVVENRWTLLRDGEGKPETVLVINTDITEKKKLEAQFLRAQRMESIGTLASGIAHDINNILSPILLSIRMLQIKFPDEDSQRVLRILQSSAERGGHMVRQVLGFARGVDGERVLLQPTHLIREILKGISETLPKAIEIQYSMIDEPWLIRADPTQFHQVMMNLIINARDAMPQGGKIRIATSNVQTDENYARMNLDATPGRYVFISITDTGTGIPPGIIDRVFDPFFTTKEQGKGTGLGLSTASTIVKKHNGFISVYSEEGKGTEFRIYLPAAESSGIMQAEQTSPELPVGHGELILVVDDESTIREITKSTLETYGYRALTAADGTEAVVLFAQHKPEIKVLMTDVMMPYMDGPATIRAIRKINPEIRIIVSSGLKTDGKAVEAASAGGGVFLSKPYTADKLLNALAEVLTGE